MLEKNVNPMPEECLKESSRETVGESFNKMFEVFKKEVSEKGFFVRTVQRNFECITMTAAEGICFEAFQELADNIPEAFLKIFSKKFPKKMSKELLEELLIGSQKKCR